MTGRQARAGRQRHAIDADMVDRETWAVACACRRHGISLIGLCGISDGATPLIGMMDWTHCLDVFDQRLAAALDVVAAGLCG